MRSASPSLVTAWVAMVPSSALLRTLACTSHALHLRPSVTHGISVCQAMPLTCSSACARGVRRRSQATLGQTRSRGRLKYETSDLLTGAQEWDATELISKYSGPPLDILVDQVSGAMCQHSSPCM